MTSGTVTEPRYEDYFDAGSLWKLYREGMYVCRETYEILRDVFQYRAHYVNYGYWPDGLETVEPGRQMAMLVGRELGLKAGDRLIDAGSGLGQASIDLCRAFDLAEVVGVNPCEPQVRFARALVESQGLSDRVRFEIEDACKFVVGAGERGFTHAMAIECITHFPDHYGFLETLRRELPSGGAVAFAVVTSSRPEQGVRKGLMKLFSGVKLESSAYWQGLLTRAGYADVHMVDITSRVIPPAVAYVRRRVEQEPGLVKRYGFATNLALRRFMATAEEGAKEGRLGYELHVGRVP
jgi:cyclopropane fatty-acyl-phospholipid synthase-like methyltransferase